MVDDGAALSGIHFAMEFLANSKLSCMLAVMDVVVKGYCLGN